MTIYCINPNCPVRENSDDAIQCQSCTTKLLIENTPISSARRQYRLHLIQPASELQLMRYSELFEVKDLETGEIRILKILKTPLLRLLEAPMYEKLVSLFKREAEILRSLRHPGIPHVKLDDFFTFDLTTSPNQLYCICMPKIEGITLKQWLDKGELLTQAQALDWLNQLAEILDYVHQNGFFHRDIKPANIMLQPDGRLMLIDFGGARPITESYLAKLSTEDNETQTPKFDDVTSLVSMEYSPLEQFNGKALPQSDFYALGRTFIELITKKKLATLSIDKQTGYTMWRKYAPHIKKPLADLIDEMVAIAPGDRPKNTRLLLHAINKLSSKHSFVYTQRFRWGIGIVVGVVLCAIGYQLGQAPANQVLAGYYYYKASEDQSKNRLSSAKANYEKSLELDPDNEVTLNDLATVCVGLNDRQCAIDNFQASAQVNPNYWVARFNLANFLEESKDYGLAEKYYRQVIDNDESPLRFDAFNNLARQKILTEDYQEAKELAQVGLRQARSDRIKATLFKNLGWSEFKLGDYKQAEDHLQQAIRLDPEMAAAHCLMGEVLEAQDKLELIKDSWRNCLQLESFLPEVEEWQKKILKKALE